MRRREFIALGGGAAAAWPLPLSAQQGRVATIGVLVFGTPPPDPFLKDFRAGLRDVGYTEGRNIRLEVRTAEGKANLLQEKAAMLVRLKVDIIVAFQTPASTAAKQATSEIPIVMVRAGDPVATGLIASLARPGGNVTGTSAGVAETVGKVVELMREAQQILVELDPPAIVVGTSAGAIIATDLAVRRPDLVRAVIEHEGPWRFTRHLPTGPQVTAFATIGSLVLRGRQSNAAEALR